MLLKEWIKCPGTKKNEQVRWENASVNLILFPQVSESIQVNSKQKKLFIKGLGGVHKEKNRKKIVFRMFILFLLLFHQKKTVSDDILNMIEFTTEYLVAFVKHRYLNKKYVTFSISYCIF